MAFARRRVFGAPRLIPEHAVRAVTAMAYTNLSIPAGFAWLSPAFRPTTREIQNYAAAIAAREGLPLEFADTFRREAELQLWVWRNENRRRTYKRRAT